MARIKITRVKKGAALETTDRVSIAVGQDGLYSWSGVVDVGGIAVRGRSPAEFGTVHEAETAAVAWAMGHGATELQIEGPDIQTRVRS